MKKLPDKIAIDGPAASGKSTVGERLAQKLDYLYFDTGVMYRAVTWAALQHLGSVDNESAVTELAQHVCIDVKPPSILDDRKYDVLVDGEDVTWEIRQPNVDKNVSQVSTYSGVREEMTAQQRRIGERGRVVMVGRDIGTVVLPAADLKVYLDASVEERARRRYLEVLKRGRGETIEEILDSMSRRDQIDSTRKIAPLIAAKDAYIINSDGMSVEEVLQKIFALID